MKLEHTKKTVIEVDYSDLEDFIEENYNVEYNIIAGEETGNDEYLSYTIKNEYLTNYDYLNLRKWTETGNGMYLLSNILQDLCVKGLIEEGNYLIHVSW